MAQQIIDNGSFDNDPTAEKIRLAFEKTNDNFTELYNRTLASGKAAERTVNWVDTGADEKAKVANSINAAPQIVVPVGTDQYISILFPYSNYAGGGGANFNYEKRLYRIKNGNGTYGSGGTALTASDIIKVAVYNEAPDASSIYDLGDIGSDTVSNFVNNNGNYIIAGVTFFKAVQNSTNKLWVFSGENGTYGLGQAQTTAFNFIDISSQGINYPFTKIFQLSLYGINTAQPELNYIAAAVANYGPFTCLPQQQIVFKTTTVIGDTNGGGLPVYNVYTRYYRVIPNVTTIGGLLNAPVYPSYFMPDGQGITTFEEDDETLIAELGDIGTDDVEDVFNLGEEVSPSVFEPWDMTVKRFVRAIYDGEVTLWAFVGEEGEYGAGGALVAGADDFFNLTEQPTTPPATFAILDYEDIAALLSHQEEQVMQGLIYVDDASADTNLTFPVGETRLQAYYRYLGTTNGTMADYKLISAPYGNHTAGQLTTDELEAIQNANTPSETNPFATMDDVAQKQAIKTGNFTLAPTDNDNTISMDGGICTINPNTQTYQDAYVVAMKNITDSTDGSIVCTAATGWTYKVNDAATVTDGTFTFPAGATCTIIKFEGTNKIYIDGGIE